MTPERALMQRELPASPYSIWAISGIVCLWFPQKLMNTHAAATVNLVMILRSRHQPWWFVEKHTAYLFHLHTMEQHLDWTLCCRHVLTVYPSCHHWQLWQKVIRNRYSSRVRCSPLLNQADKNQKRRDVTDVDVPADRNIRGKVKRNIKAGRTDVEMPLWCLWSWGNGYKRAAVGTVSAHSRQTCKSNMNFAIWF